MRPITKIFALAVALVSSSAAFAYTRAAVNIPFNFETRGKVYPAGIYDVQLNQGQNLLILSSHDHTKLSLMWTASPADFGPETPMLSMKFDNDENGTHALRTIRLASRTTPVLDVRERHAAQREVSITGGR